MLPSSAIAAVCTPSLSRNLGWKAQMKRLTAWAQSRRLELTPALC
jgi:hypothetical protein